MHTKINIHSMRVFLPFFSDSLFILKRRIIWIVILTFVFKCGFMYLLGLSILREGNTIRGS